MKRTCKQNRPERPKRSQRRAPAKKETFHPGRKEHAEQYIAAMADPKSRSYAERCLARIWSGSAKSAAPRRPSGLSAARAKEIDAAMYGIFATLR